jgi:hypothetical protein
LADKLRELLDSRRLEKGGNGKFLSESFLDLTNEFDS